jgi:hypothetical protein
VDDVVRNGNGETLFCHAGNSLTLYSWYHRLDITLALYNLSSRR